MSNTKYEEKLKNLYLTSGVQRVLYDIIKAHCVEPECLAEGISFFHVVQDMEKALKKEGYL